MRMTLGEMLKRFRIEKEIKAEEICEGLCTRTLIIYYESGKGAPDTLLFIRFMERMGVSPELFALMVSEKENEYYKWQEQINEAIEAKQWECVGELLEQPVAFENECNEVLVRQYYYYTKAIYFHLFIKAIYPVFSLFFSDYCRLSFLHILILLIQFFLIFFHILYKLPPCIFIFHKILRTVLFCNIIMTNHILFCQVKLSAQPRC